MKRRIRKNISKPYDHVGAIMQYEDGSLDEDGVIELFQYLVDTGLAWQLQGHYGRTAKSLIEAGYVTPRSAKKNPRRYRRNSASRSLDGFDRWMVKQNLEYVKSRGLKAVVANLRRQGYNRVADAVQQAAAARKNHRRKRKNCGCKYRRNRGRRHRRNNGKKSSRRVSEIQKMANRAMMTRLAIGDSNWMGTPLQIVEPDDRADWLKSRPYRKRRQS